MDVLLKCALGEVMIALDSDVSDYGPRGIAYRPRTRPSVLSLPLRRCSRPRSTEDTPQNHQKKQDTNVDRKRRNRINDSSQAVRDAHSCHYTIRRREDTVATRANLETVETRSATTYIYPQSGDGINSGPSLWRIGRPK